MFSGGIERDKWNGLNTNNFKIIWMSIYTVDVKNNSWWTDAKYAIPESH